MRENTQPLQPAPFMEPATALQAAVWFLGLCAGGPVDLTRQPGSLYLTRTIFTLRYIALQKPQAAPVINEAVRWLQQAVNAPCDFSDQADRINNLIDRLVQVKPGPA